MAVHNKFKDSFPKKKLVCKVVKQIKYSFRNVYAYIGMSLILPDLYAHAHAHVSNTVNEISFPN
jgi:hypothetical protein